MGVHESETHPNPSPGADMLHSTYDTAKRLNITAQGSTQENPGKRGINSAETPKRFYKACNVKPFQGFLNFDFSLLPGFVCVEPRALFYNRFAVLSSVLFRNVSWYLQQHFSWGIGF